MFFLIAIVWVINKTKKIEGWKGGENIQDIRVK